jgi:TolB protein
MKTIQSLVFVTLILLMLNVGVSPIYAKAPTTPKILFTSLRDGNSEIYIMNPDGSEQVNLTQHPAIDQQPVWSPTGEQILFISNRRDFRPRGRRDLYLMDPDGSNVRRVFKKKIEGWRVSPSWSPDGKQIAYRQKYGANGTMGTYIATLGEQDEEFFVKGSAPAWSPDGTEIACGVAEPGREWIVFIDVRTRKRERLLPKKSLPWQNAPSWSATGDRLAFSGNNHPLPVIAEKGLDEAKALHNAWRDKETIFVVNRDGTNLQQLVDEAGPDAGYPELSPNGEEVLYTQEINERSQIFKVDVNSGVQTQLTHIGGMPRFGNWGGDWFDPAFALPVSPQPQLLTTTWGEVKKE